MQNEVGHAVYIAIGFVVLGIVLQFVMVGLNIQKDIGGMRTEEIVAAQNMHQHRLYDRYDGKVLIGDEVIEAIRYFYDTGIDIFVNHRQNDYITTDGDIDRGHIDSTDVLDGDDPRYYNVNQYRLHSLRDSGCTAHGDYFNISAQLYDENGTINRDAADKYIIQNWYPTQCRYMAVLGYNSENLEKLATDILDDFNNDSYVIANLDTMTLGERAEYMQRYIPKHPVNGEVTGIVLIDLDNPSMECELCNELRVDNTN